MPPEGLRKSLMEMLPEAPWQRCYVHFLKERPRPPAPQGQQRLSARTQVALQPPRRGGSSEGPIGLAFPPHTMGPLFARNQSSSAKKVSISSRSVK